MVDSFSMGENIYPFFLRRKDPIFLPALEMLGTEVSRRLESSFLSSDVHPTFVRMRMTVLLYTLDGAYTYRHKRFYGLKSFTVNRFYDYSI